MKAVTAIDSLKGSLSSLRTSLLLYADKNDLKNYINIVPKIQCLCNCTQTVSEALKIQFTFWKCRGRRGNKEPMLLKEVVNSFFNIYWIQVF